MPRKEYSPIQAESKIRKLISLGMQDPLIRKDLTNKEKKTKHLKFLKRNHKRNRVNWSYDFQEKYLRSLFVKLYDSQNKNISSERTSAHNRYLSRQIQKISRVYSQLIQKSKSQKYESRMKYQLAKTVFF